MNGHTLPTLILELERADDESIAGRVSTASGTAITFAGWLGLAGAIDAALRAGVAGDDRQRSEGGRSDD